MADDKQVLKFNEKLVEAEVPSDVAQLVVASETTPSELNSNEAATSQQVLSAPHMEPVQAIQTPS